MADIYFEGPLPENLIRVQLDGVTLVYHRNAGATHVVTEPLPEIVAALSSGSVTFAALLDRLGLDAHPDTETALFARLDELEASGLVTRQ